MSVLLLVGYGPGNSHAIARRFGAAGCTIALVGRNSQRLNDGMESLTREGVTAHSFVGDASDDVSIRSTIQRVQKRLGPVSTVAFTAFQHVLVPDVLDTAPETVEQVFRLGVTGLLTVVQATREDLIAQRGSVLVVNGALGIRDPQIDAYAAAVGGDGVALECAAKSKLVGLLAEHLRADGVYVGEVVINGSVQGTPSAGPSAIDPADVADRLWALSRERTEIRADIAEPR